MSAMVWVERGTTPEAEQLKPRATSNDGGGPPPPTPPTAPAPVSAPSVPAPAPAPSPSPAPAPSPGAQNSEKKGFSLFGRKSKTPSEPVVSQLEQDEELMGESTFSELEEFIHHLQQGMVVTKMNSSNGAKRRRVLYVDSTGQLMRYRNVSVKDYPSIVEYTKATETAKKNGAKTQMMENKRKHPLSMFDLKSVRSYASEDGEEKLFIIRLKFRNPLRKKYTRNVDFQLDSKEDFIYVVKGFNLLKTSSESFEEMDLKTKNSWLGRLVTKKYNDSEEAIGEAIEEAMDDDDEEEEEEEED
ncbi:hypothetical protein TrST_g12641 [Triparma strigata]|uniref:Uncharacterized protein n=1 Tax=Triparma strigata TaxID=1606541 RepID=A0A9W7BW21_9STRA|nr:hypothetical protein TrST_g12641 [Triparma strigata]